MTQSNHRSVLETLADLVRIHSVNPNYPGGVNEAEMADYIEQFFARRGIETWRQSVLPDRANVIARVPGRDSSRRIVFEAHMDTVSTEGMTIEPWNPEVRDGKMYGRGACDTKGGMAAMMHAVANLVDEGITPSCDVLFAAAIDEEYSFRGAVALCEGMELSRSLTSTTSDRPLQADAAIIAEPTSLQCVIASKGLVRWKVETLGKAAHSSKPHLGNNAIEQMAHLITAFQHDTVELSKRDHPLLGPATCSIGVIRGGVQINFVPDRCEIEIDRRMLPSETCEEVLAHYQNLIDSTAATHPGIHAVMHEPMLTDRPLETDPSTLPVQTMMQVLGNMGLDSAPVGVPFCSDASKFGALGIPSMIIGPGSIDQAHAAVEYIECEQVLLAMQIYQRFMIEFE